MTQGNKTYLPVREFVWVYLQLQAVDLSLAPHSLKKLVQQAADMDVFSTGAGRLYASAQVTNDLLFDSEQTVRTFAKQILDEIGQLYSSLLNQAETFGFQGPQQTLQLQKYVNETLHSHLQETAGLIAQRNANWGFHSQFADYLLANQNYWAFLPAAVTIYQELVSFLGEFIKLDQVRSENIILAQNQLGVISNGLVLLSQGAAFVPDEIERVFQGVSKPISTILEAGVGSDFYRRLFELEVALLTTVRDLAAAEQY